MDKNGNLGEFFSLKANNSKTIKYMTLPPVCKFYWQYCWEPSVKISGQWDKNCRWKSILSHWNQVLLKAEERNRQNRVFSPLQAKIFTIETHKYIYIQKWSSQWGKSVAPNLVGVKTEISEQWAKNQSLKNNRHFKKRAR